VAEPLSDEEAVRLADLNYANAFRAVAECAKGGKFYEEPGLVAALTGPIAWLNVTVVHDALGDPTAALKRVIDFYREAGTPFVVRIRVGFEMETQRAIQELGLKPAALLPGMVLNPVGEIPPLAAGLEIVRLDAERFTAYKEIIGASFGMPPQVVEHLMTSAMLDSPLRGYLGYVDGSPVTTSALIATDGVAGVYNVATLPEYRGRGLGEAMTWHAVREGMAIGCRFGSLQASEMGRPVYARMGFRDIAPYETFTLPVA